MSGIDLQQLGWNEFFARQLNGNDSELVCGRVLAEHRTEFQIATLAGEVRAQLSGRARFEAPSPADLPVVGDWVLLTRADAARGRIQRVLPRRSKLARTAAGDVTETQVIAANIDVIFVVASLNLELSARRIERYLTLVWDSGALPVIVLNKADLCADVETLRREIERVALGVEVLTVSALRNDGVAQLQKYLRFGQTGALVGSSGVGKSTLINALLGAQQMPTQSLSADGQRGLHTTTHRQLFVLPGGGMLIDTPGMRELQLNEDTTGLGQTFADIEILMQSCRFNDCNHESEPGCAVKAALDSGALDAARLESYQKLQREAQYQARRHDQAAKSRERDKWKRVHVAQRKMYKARGLK